MLSWSTIPSSAVGFKLSINVRRKNFLKISTYLRIWVHAYGIETTPNSQSVSFWKLRPGNMGRLIFTTELDTTIPTVRNGVERVPHLSSEEYQDKGRTPICKYMYLWKSVWKTRNCRDWNSGCSSIWERASDVRFEKLGIWQKLIKLGERENKFASSLARRGLRKPSPQAKLGDQKGHTHTSSQEHVEIARIHSPIVCLE